MAAAEYYNSSGGGGSRPQYPPTNPFEGSSSSTFTQGALPSSSLPSAQGQSSTAYDPYNDTSYHSSNSYPDPYADNIPLKDQSNTHIHGSHSPDIESHGQHASAKPVYLAAGGGGGGGGGKRRKRSRWRNFAWASWGLGIIQIGVFIGEIIRNQQITGQPIATKPQFNFMIGPSMNVLINMGSRYTPCMRVLPEDDTLPPNQWMCPNTVSNRLDDFTCTLNELCGLGGVPKDKDGNFVPNQWYRFITPIFLHGGLIHIGFNMLIQLRLGADMEKEIGIIRYLIVYFASGIFGNVLSASFLPPAISSMGASGALFGVIAIVLLDLIYHWSELRHPVRDLVFLLLQIIISFLLGLLPYLDNFAHIGGFLMGLMLGLAVLHSPPGLSRKLAALDPPYTPVDPSMPVTSSPGRKSFIRDPKGFFLHRKPLWWAWWLVRAGMLIAAIIMFSVLLSNFYSGKNNCEWCKYLSCIVSVSRYFWFSASAGDGLC